MADSMMFPNSWGEFLKDYSFKDKEEVYTNGSILIPVFRVEQMVEHYFNSAWIPVSERLPEEWKEVLVLSEFDFCETAVYLGIPGKWRVTWNHDMLEENSITHWMPLPNPPEEV